MAEKLGKIGVLTEPATEECDLGHEHERIPEGQEVFVRKAMTYSHRPMDKESQRRLEKWLTVSPVQRGSVHPSFTMEVPAGTVEVEEAVE